MSFDEIYRVIFSGAASVASLLPVAQLIRSAKRGVMVYDGIPLFRGDNPRAFRLDLWIDGTAALLILASAALMWTLPAEGRFAWTLPAGVWAALYMTWFRWRSLNPWVRKHTLLAFIIVVLAIGGLTLILQRLGL
jgi:hypothetical protein